MNIENEETTTETNTENEETTTETNTENEETISNENIVIARTPEYIHDHAIPWSELTEEEAIAYNEYKNRIAAAEAINKQINDSMSALQLEEIKRNNELAKNALDTLNDMYAQLQASSTDIELTVQTLPSYEELDANDIFKQLESSNNEN